MKKQYLRYRLNGQWIVKNIDDVSPVTLIGRQQKSFSELSKHLKETVKLWSYEVTGDCNFNQKLLHQDLVQCYQLLNNPDLFPLISNSETREGFLVSISKEIEKIEHGDYEPADTLTNYLTAVEDVSIELIVDFDDKKKTCVFELRDMEALNGILAFKPRLD